MSENGEVTSPLREFCAWALERGLSKCERRQIDGGVRVRCQQAAQMIREQHAALIADAVIEVSGLLLRHHFKDVYERELLSLLHGCLVVSIEQREGWTYIDEPLIAMEKTAVRTEAYTQLVRNRSALQASKLWKTIAAEVTMHVDRAGEEEERSKINERRKQLGIGNHGSL